MNKTRIDLDNGDFTFLKPEGIESITSKIKQFIHLQSAGIAPQTSHSIEFMKEIIEDLEKINPRTPLTQAQHSPHDKHAASDDDQYGGT